MGLTFWTGDPEDTNAKQVNIYDYFKIQGGPLAELLNPTHNISLLKAHRLSLYEKHKARFLQDRDLNRVETTNEDLFEYYKLWLDNELSVVKKWIDEKPTAAILIELQKYIKFIISEKQSKDRPLAKSEDFVWLCKTEHRANEIKKRMKIEDYLDTNDEWDTLKRKPRHLRALIKVLQRETKCFRQEATPETIREIFISEFKAEISIEHFRPARQDNVKEELLDEVRQAFKHIK